MWAPNSPAGGRKGSGEHGLVWPEISNIKGEKECAPYSPAGGREGSGKHGLVWPEISNIKLERKGARPTLQRVVEKDQVTTMDLWPIFFVQRLVILK